MKHKVYQYVRYGNIVNVVLFAKTSKDNDNCTDDNVQCATIENNSWLYKLIKTLDFYVSYLYPIDLITFTESGKNVSYHLKPLSLHNVKEPLRI